MNANLFLLSKETVDYAKVTYSIINNIMYLTLYVHIILTTSINDKKIIYVLLLKNVN